MARNAAPSAQRPLDRLLPAAVALVLGAGTLAAALGGIAADAFVGRPSAASGFGFVLMLPIAIFAAIVGFAAGHGIGALLKRRGLSPQVEMRPYRVVMAFVLGAATVIGATFGARPVLRHERLFEPRVRAGDGAMIVEEGWPAGCRLEPAPSICNPSSRNLSAAILSNFGEISAMCTRDGRVTLSRPDGAIVGDADLSAYQPLRDLRAIGARLPSGGEAFALIAAFNREPDRHLLMVFDADGKRMYEQMIDGATRGSAEPLMACAAESGDSFVVDLDGKPVTYRPR